MIPPKTSLLLLASVGAVHPAQAAATASADGDIHYFWMSMAFKNHVCAIRPPPGRLDCSYWRTRLAALSGLNRARIHCSTRTVTYAAHCDIETIFSLLRIGIFHYDRNRASECT